MHVRRFLGAAALILAVVASAIPLAARAQSASDALNDADADHAIVTGGPWHFRSVPCVDGTVDDVGPRLEPDAPRGSKDYFDSGVTVSVALDRPTEFIPHVTRSDAEVVHYQDTYDNAVMEQERAGDRVQVCLMGFPTPSYDPSEKRFICDPDADPRGWVFRIYDYRRKVAFFGPDSEHLCGGA